MEAFKTFISVFISILLLTAKTLEATVLCGNIPPGIAKLSRGVDITTLDLLPLDNSEANGFGRTLFSFTCDKGKRWVNPFNTALSYDVPDQVETINTIPGKTIVLTQSSGKNFEFEEKERHDTVCEWAICISSLLITAHTRR